MTQISYKEQRKRKRLHRANGTFPKRPNNAPHYTPDASKPLTQKQIKERRTHSRRAAKLVRAAGKKSHGHARALCENNRRDCKSLILRQI